MLRLGPFLCVLIIYVRETSVGKSGHKSKTLKAPSQVTIKIVLKHHPNPTSMAKQEELK